MRTFAKLALWTLAASLLPLTASAAEGGESGSSLGLALGAGLAIGLAGFGCGIGQGLTAGNTTAGIARNPGAARVKEQRAHGPAMIVARASMAISACEYPASASTSTLCSPMRGG